MARVRHIMHLRYIFRVRIGQRERESGKKMFASRLCSKTNIFLMLAQAQRFGNFSVVIYDGKLREIN